MLHAVADSEFEPLVEVFAESNGKRSFEAWMIHILDGCIDYALAHPRIFDYVFFNAPSWRGVSPKTFARGAHQRKT